MKVVNLTGFDLIVAGKTIPAGNYRAVAPQLNGQEADPVHIDGIGEVPTVYGTEVNLEDCRLMPGDIPFPDPEDGVIYLAPIPVRLAAKRAGRTDVWGMGNRVVPRDPAKGVKNLVR